MLTGLKAISNLTLGIALMLFPLVVSGQTVTVDRSVIATAGMDSKSGELHVTATIGEPVVFNSKIGPNEYTQGYQQNDDIILNLPLMFTSEITRTQCPDIHTGMIAVFPTGCKPPYSVTITKDGDSIPTEVIEDVMAAESAKFSGLDSGTYTVTVRGANLCTEDSTYRLDLEYLDCDVEIYSGITPNGDGKNDFWVISNIESNQPNTVRIYSRWGSLVWRIENYDNEFNVWNGQSNGGSHLPDGTYFYVIEIDGNPDASGSGWIQLTR